MIRSDNNHQERDQHSIETIVTTTTLLARSFVEEEEKEI